MILIRPDIILECVQNSGIVYLIRPDIRLECEHSLGVVIFNSLISYLSVK